MTNRIHFHDDVPHSPEIKDEFERLSTVLRQEFPEISKIEVSLSHTRDDLETHLHVIGKDLELAGIAHGHSPSESLGNAFERVRRQLRKHHDKTIFGKRRDAQKTRA